MPSRLPPPGQIESLLARADELRLSARARERLAWLRHLALCGSVTETGRLFGVPRVTLYRLVRRFDPRDTTSLEDRSRRPHTIHRVLTPDVLDRIRLLRLRDPAANCHALSAALRAEHALSVSPASVQRALVRAGMPTQMRPSDRLHDSLTTPAAGTDPAGDRIRIRPHGRVRVGRALAVGSVLVGLVLAGLLVVGSLAPDGPWW